jgi:hypothetical protein
LRRIITLLTAVAAALVVTAAVCLPTALADSVLYLPLVHRQVPAASFTATPTPILHGRDTPILVSPLNRAELSTLAPELIWRSAEDHWYGIEISTDPRFSALAQSVPPSTHCGAPQYRLQLMANLEPATLYYWRVGYDDDTGIFTWSEVWSFTTPAAGTATPAAPLPALPEDGSTVSSLTPCLSWQGLDGVTTYHITLGVRDSIFTFSVLAPTPGQLVPFELLVGRTYAWHVRAFNGYAWGPESTTWYFRTPGN